MTVEFKEWPKTPRLMRNITITEKIDGTNAAIGIVPMDREDADDDPSVFGYVPTPEGSVAAPGFMNPEGICVYQSASRAVSKVTLDKNDAGKWESAA